MKADLFNKYKKSVEEGTQVPPREVWNNISNQMDIDDNWVDISNQLDVEQVWGNIARELDTGILISQKPSFTSTLPGKAVLAVASVIILGLLAFFTNKLLNPPTDNVPMLTELSEPAAVSDKTEKLQQIEDIAEIPEPPGNIPVTGPPDNNIMPSEPAITGRDENIIPPGDTSDEDEADDDAKASTAKNLQIVEIAEISNPGIEVIPAQTTILESGMNAAGIIIKEGIAGFKQKKAVYLSPIEVRKSELVNYDKDRFYPDYKSISPSTVTQTNKHLKTWKLGFAVSTSNNWLINRETFSGFKPSELSSTILDFSVNWEFVADIPLGNNWWLRNTIYGQNTSGQSYKNYFEGSYTTKSIDLKYAGINMLGKHKAFAPWLRDPRLSFNTSFGFYFNYLRSAEQTIAGTSVDVSDQYKSVDYGIVFGHEIEFQAWSKISVAPGLKFNWGIPNIYKGNENIPSSFKNTHTGSIELTFGIYYLIVK